MEHVQLHRAVVFDVDGSDDVHAGIVADRRRHELEAGGRDDPARQPDRADSHAAECACRSEIRHPIPGVCARQLRDARCEHSRRFCARLWRADGSAFSRGSAAWRSPQMVNILAPSTEAMPWVGWTCFIGFWLLNMVVVWRGVESIRFLQSYSAPFMLVMSALLLGSMLHKAGGFGPMLSAPSRFTDYPAFLRYLPSIAYGHGGILGNVVAQHSRLHALCKESGRADLRPGLRLARCDDAVLLPWDRRARLPPP